MKMHLGFDPRDNVDSQKKAVENLSVFKIASMHRYKDKKTT